MIQKVIIRPNLLEHAVEKVAPKRAISMFEKRLKRLQQKAIREAGVTMAASGYGNHGADRRKTTLLGFTPIGGDAAAEIDVHGSLLRKRARDLDAGGGITRGATRTLKTNVIGGGIIPKPKIDYETLGIPEESALQWQRKAQREFALWAQSKNCDATRRHTFYQLQQLAYLSTLLSGDVIAMLPMYPVAGTPYSTHVRLLEADMVSTPDSNGESTVTMLANGGRIVDGVEMDAQGTVVAYHITNRHPLARNDMRTIKHTRIEAFGRTTGTPNVLHVMTAERPDQARGVPFVAPMIEQLKQLDRYVGAELTANIISTMLTLFFTQDAANPGMPGYALQDAVPDGEKVTTDESLIELRPGAIYKLEPGLKPEVVSPLRPNSSYGEYVTSQIKQIGAGMEIPAEVLLKVFNSNYSASRGALLEFWRMVKVLRENFTASFNQPIYEAWLAEAVATGRLEAPGFFEDPLRRMAWCGVEWIGWNMGSIDPLKEVKAAQLRIDLNLSTEEREAAEMNGSDWYANVAQRRKEKAFWPDAEEEEAEPANNQKPEEDEENA